MADLAVRRGWAVVDLNAWGEFQREFPSVAQNTLRHDLFDTGLPLDPLVEGVRFDTIEDFHRSLTALAARHRANLEQQPGQPMTTARSRVLEGRRKAELALRNPRLTAEKRAAMQEKFLWLRTWLENPGLFEGWAALRLKKLRNLVEDF
ncbi:MAG: hypothetical protein LC114_12065 [Bryobacterales bacterium]|nr:hypothetical protein [Bryobacterales bacterium]